MCWVWWLWLKTVQYGKYGDLVYTKDSVASIDSSVVNQLILKNLVIMVSLMILKNLVILVKSSNTGE